MRSSGCNFLTAAHAAISRNAADQQFGGLNSQLVLGQFHSRQPRPENAQPRIIVKTYQSEIFRAAQAHLFGRFQQTHVIK